MLPDEVRALFEGPNYGHVATLLPDGSPHSVAVWVGLEGEEIVFFTQTTSQKSRNLERDPRVEAWEVIDRLAVRYTGDPFPFRPDTSIVYYVEPLKVGSMQLPFQHRPATA